MCFAWRIELAPAGGVVAGVRRGELNEALRGD
jgi:hypothetical protein